MNDPFNIPEIGRKTTPHIDPRSLRPARVSGDSKDVSFKDTLSGAITEVQRLQNDADHAIRDLVSGEVKDITEAMVAIEKADVSFQTMMAVRNKIVAAYQEVMRMQV